MSTFLIYKSSAGSGKTTALVQLLLSLSLRTEDPYRFKKILAITFTNKAAAEMKERLLEELHKLSSVSAAEANDHFIIAYLLQEIGIDFETLSGRAATMFRNVLQDFNDLSIGTIDQFNHRLIRSFSRELKLSSDFEVELDEAALFSEAVNRLLDQVGRNERVTRHLTGFIATKLGDEKKVNVARELENLRPLIMSEAGIRAIAALRSNDELDFGELGASLSRKIGEIKKVMQESGQEVLALIEKSGLEVDDFSNKKGGVMGFFLKLASFPFDKGIDLNSVRLLAALHEGKWLTKSAPSAIVQKFESIENELNTKLKNTYEYCSKEQPKFYLYKTVRQQLDLIAVINELTLCFDEVSAERNVLPISKFNKLISEALRKESVAFLYETYGNRYDHILIDEYQDTSELQWFNLVPLILESLAKGKLSMVVGDAKQSIYRWRGGKAEQLIALPRLIDAPEDIGFWGEETLERTAATVRLSNNYRSEANIIEFNNWFFTELGQLLPAQSLYAEEYAKGSVSQDFFRKGDLGQVSLSYLGKDGDHEGHLAFVVGEISRYRESGFRYGDIAILLRGKKERQLILEGLTEAGIPVSTASSFELDKDWEVKFILSLFKLSLDATDDVAAITLMRYFEALRGVPFLPDHYSKNGQIGWKQFMADQALRPLSGLAQLGAFELTRELIAGYLPDSDNPFLGALKDCVLRQVGMQGTPVEFNTWWESLLEKPSAPAVNTGNSIQLMTIHKSKGLQFPIVILPEMDWMLRPNKQELRWFDISSPDFHKLAYAPLKLNSTLVSLGFEKAWIEEETAMHFDQLNTMYVALTRAEKALSISYTTKDKQRIGCWIYEAVEKLEKADWLAEKVFRKTGEGEDSYTITIGSDQTSEAHPEAKDNSGNLLIPPLSTRSWKSKITLAVKNTSESERIGVLFHQLASDAHTLTDGQMKLNRLRSQARVTPSEAEALSSLLEALFADENYLSLIQDALRISERDLFFNGSAIRPDLVLEKKDATVLIDFKTGAESEENIMQVKNYLTALKEISKKPVSGYLLYFNPIRWVPVDPV